MSHSIAFCLALAEDLKNTSDSPRLDTEILLAHALKRDRTYLYTWPDRSLSKADFDNFLALLERRKAGEPVAHILGEREFWSMPLYVDRSTLIPRPDTELLVELALTRLGKDSQVLDLGTGTGAIALALAKECPESSIVAVDFSEQAVALAERNRQRHGLKNVQVFQSDWFGAVDGLFDLIVANPPYISKNDVHLEQGDLRYEPLSALVAEDNGLKDLKTIILDAKRYLKKDAWLMLEHGWEQGPAVRQIFENCAYSEVETLKDYAGNDRVTQGRYSKSGG